MVYIRMVKLEERLSRSYDSQVQEIRCSLDFC